MNVGTSTPRSLATTATLLVAVLVVGLTVSSVRRAYAAVVTANALVTSRATPAGGVSADVVIPVLNQPVHVSAAVTSPAGLRGTVSGAVTRHVAGGVANTISWAFVNGGGTAPATLAGNAAAVGTDVAYISPGGVNTSNGLEIGATAGAAAIRVENDEALATNTVFTLVW